MIWKKYVVIQDILYLIQEDVNLRETELLKNE